jgi:ankyrin repeat protein
MTKQQKFYKYILKNNFIKLEKLLFEKTIFSNEYVIDPTKDENHSILLASRLGHFKIVEILLKDKRVNPSSERECPLSLAAENGHIEVVNILLKDKRINPISRNNYAIRCAYENGHTEIVEILLNIKSVKEYLKTNSILNKKIMTKYIKNKLEQF